MIKIVEGRINENLFQLNIVTIATSQLQENRGQGNGWGIFLDLMCLAA